MFDVVKTRAQFSTAAEARVSTAADYEELPAVSQLLAGVAGNPGEAMVSPPHSLILWLEGDWVKFCITAGDFQPKCWGSFQGLARGLAGVEKALQDNHCDWRRPKGTEHGLTNGKGYGKS